MQKIKRIAADIFKWDIILSAAVCSGLILCARYIYITYPPSWLRFWVLIAIGFFIFGIINTVRINYLINMFYRNQQRTFSLAAIKEGFGLGLYYIFYPLCAAIFVLFEFIFCALIKTDMLYFVILAVFTAVLFIMFFFTFIAGIELEYISKNFDFKSLFAFKQLVYKYSSAKLARFTAVSVAQFALILLIFEFAKKGISLLIYTLALFLIILMVLGFNWILENYKFNVYNSDL